VSRRSLRLPWDALTVAAIAAVIGVAFVLHVLWFAPNYDVDWLLIAARRMLAGGSYLLDFDEVTPPLVLVLMAPAAALADVTGHDPYAVFVASVCVLIAVSLLLSAPVVDWCLPGNPGGRRLALIAIAVVLALEPGFRFGQREHLVMIMLLPGLLWYAARESGRPSPFSPSVWLCLALAAASLLIKPYFLLIAAALLLVRLVRTRDWRAALFDPPVGVLAATLALFALMVAFLFPEYLEEVRLENQTYGAFANGWLSVFERYRDAIAACCVMALLAELVPVPASSRLVLRCLWLASACALVVAIVQKKGWAYQMLPAVEIAAVGLVIAAAAIAPGLRQRAERLRVVMVLATIGVFGMVLALRPVDEALADTKVHFASQPLIKTLHEFAAGRKVMLLTSGLQQGFPSLAGVQLAARHPGQPMLPGTVRLENGSERDRVRAAALRQVLIGLILKDLRRYEPDVIVVDRNADKQALPADFDILTWFLADPAFRRAWADYRLVTKAPGWDFYERRSVASAVAPPPSTR
jgi:hypothetical protein